MIAGIQIQFLGSSSPKNHATEIQPFMQRILTMLLCLSCPTGDAEELVLFTHLKCIPNSVLFCKEKEDHLKEEKYRPIFSQ